MSVFGAGEGSLLGAAIMLVHLNVHGINNIFQIV